MRRLCCTVLVLLLAACGDVPEPADTDAADVSNADDGVVTANFLGFRDAYARAAPSGGVSAIYMQIENTTDAADTLVAARTDAAGDVELHQTTVTNDGQRVMEPVDGGLPVGAGQTVILEPGGPHLMLLDLQRDLTPGDSLLIEFDFAGRGTLTSRVPVRPLAAGE